MNDGGPAFPCFIPGYSDVHGVGGMSLRDYFAAQALAGIFACDKMVHAMTLERKERGVEAAAKSLAGIAYQIADAMLTEHTKD